MGTQRFRKRRLIADALSATNLLCGVASIFAALHGRVDVSLLLLLAGALCDGLDGLAARRFGGTKLGVLADDVADGVSYAIAPAFALAVVVDGAAGVVIGVVYACFTIARLVYFTLAKGTSDPAWFSGMPSTIGALVALTSCILFPHAPAIVGALVGVALSQMVSFDARHRHLGRVLFARRRRVAFAAACAVAWLVADVLLGAHVAAALLLSAAVAYALAPSCRRFVEVLRARRDLAASTPAS